MMSETDNAKKDVEKSTKISDDSCPLTFIIDHADAYIFSKAKDIKDQRKEDKPFFDAVLTIGTWAREIRLTRDPLHNCKCLKLFEKKIKRELELIEKMKISEKEKNFSKIFLFDVFLTSFKEKKDIFLLNDFNFKDLSLNKNFFVFAQPFAVRG